MDAYTGLVATRGLMPISLNTTNRQLMARSPRLFQENCTSIQCVYANFYVNPASTHAEIGSGSAATITASIEYPAGVRNQLLFGGSPSGVIPDNGLLVSDPLSLTTTRGTWCWPLTFWTSTTGVLSIPHDLTGTGLPGAGLEVAVSGLTDKTMSGTVTPADNEYGPIAIIGTTTRNSVVIVGDSIGLGDSSKETVGDASGDFGVVARSIGPYYAYSSLCQNGDQAEDFVASHTNRAALFAYASHLICEYGSNDLYTNSASAATVLGLLQSIWGYHTALGPEKVACQTSIAPRTNSTDNWATTGGQSQVSSTVNTRRISVNNTNAALPAGLHKYFDINAALEASPGIWKVTGSANGYVVDGIHPNTAGSLLIPASGVIALETSFSARQLLMVGVG